MPQMVTIDPVTRIEGHLGIKVEVENGVVSEAWSAGESYRGFEQILTGRDPRDAQHITQRICGVCPIEHGVAAVLAQDMAFGMQPPTNGRLCRNLMTAANFIQSHILHFYTLSAVDFIDVTAVLGYEGAAMPLRLFKSWVRNELGHSDYFPVAPLLPRFAGAYLGDAEINLGALRNYIGALDIRTEASRWAPCSAAKFPHAATLIAGGVTQPVTACLIVNAQKIVQKLRHFIETCYLPDVMPGGGRPFRSTSRSAPVPTTSSPSASSSETNDGSTKLLPGGVLLDGALTEVDQSLIVETVGTSKFSAASGGHPYTETNSPESGKPGAYSWLKAPRYDGNVMEVGPLARMQVATARGDLRLAPLVAQTLATLGLTADDLNSVMGRHLARALECKVIADRCAGVDRCPAGRRPGAQRPYRASHRAGIRTHRSGARRARALDENRRRSGRELPVRGADHLELLTPRRRGSPRSRRTGTGGHPGRGPRQPARGGARGALFRPVPFLCGPLITMTKPLPMQTTQDRPRHFSRPPAGSLASLRARGRSGAADGPGRRGTVRRDRRRCSGCRARTAADVRCPC